jgi:hypothetical protein
MEFNIKKCKIMHLGHNNPGHVYTMKNQQLETTEIATPSKSSTYNM